MTLNTFIRKYLRKKGGLRYATAIVLPNNSLFYFNFRKSPFLMLKKGFIRKLYRAELTDIHVNNSGLGMVDLNIFFSNGETTVRLDVAPFYPDLYDLPIEVKAAIAKALL